MEDFIGQSNKILNQEIDKNEFDKLLEILACLNKIEQRSLETDVMFEPLKGEMDLLKTYGEEFSNHINLQVRK